MEKIFSIPHIIFLCYILIVSLVSFCMYGIDKRKAQKDKWRIKEKTLIISAYIGGALGALLGMLLFHHKTRHTKFIILVPLAVILWAAVTVLFFIYI